MPRLPSSDRQTSIRGHEEAYIAGRYSREGEKKRCSAAVACSTVSTATTMSQHNGTARGKKQGNASTEETEREKREERERAGAGGGQMVKFSPAIAHLHVSTPVNGAFAFRSPMSRRREVRRRNPCYAFREWVIRSEPVMRKRAQNQTRNHQRTPNRFKNITIGWCR